MKLFIYEHITSGALANQTLPISLAQEGDAMLTALVQDLNELPQLELVILRDSRLDSITIDADNIPPQYYWVNNPEHFSDQWQHCLTEVEAVVIIAPETKGQLIRIQQGILDHHQIYLGCSQQATAICSNKLLCYQHLLTHNIATPITYTALTWRNDFSPSSRLIIKPIDGAGCLDTLLFDNAFGAQCYLKKVPANKIASIIIQPYIQGKAISLSLFINHKKAILLTINEQHINHENKQLIFDSCSVNTISETEFPRSVAQKLADNIRDAIPGLWGFVGIDLVLSSSGPIVIEINPRMTTSYVGLKQAINKNPAEFLIKNMHDIMDNKISLS